MQRLSEPRRFIQVLAGPRQTGKTTLAGQVIEDISIPAHYASADEPALKDRLWIEQQWDIGRLRGQSNPDGGKGLIILDEIQKIPGWSETIKRLWDEDTRKGRNLLAVILGSSPLLVRRGLAESLAGRFEIIPVTHWFFEEMRDAFGWNLEQYLYYGGYPGSAALIGDKHRWSAYISDALIETTVSRDVLLMTRVDKPALLRRLFDLGCLYSGQVLSYQKMLGRLQDAGNTVTLAHYLDLLKGAGLLTGIPKYAGHKVRQRGSSPKLLVLNNALMTSASPLSLGEAREDTEYWGRLVESAVGASLVNGSVGKGIDVFYWSARNREVDFVLSRGEALVAIEVKSGRRRTGIPGIADFSKQFKVKKKLLVGAEGMPLEEFFLLDPTAFFG